MRFDLIILGDTPDAWAAAEEAALLGRSTAVVRPDDGSGRATGVAAVLAAFGDGTSFTSRQLRSPGELWNDAVARHEAAVTRLTESLGIMAWQGAVRFTDRNVVTVASPAVRRTLTGDLVLIAVGTSARRPRGLVFDRRTLLLPEDVCGVEVAPQRLAVIGGNRTACAFAGLFAAAGSRVSQIDSRRGEASPAVDSRIVGDVLDLRQNADGAAIRMTDGRTVRADAVLFAADRVGDTAALSLPAAGLEADEDGRLWCDDAGVTWVPTIRAAGEVVGYPRRLREANAAKTLFGTSARPRHAAAAVRL